MSGDRGQHGIPLGKEGRIPWRGDRLRQARGVGRLARERKGQRIRSASAWRRLEQPRRRVTRPDITGRDRQLDLLPGGYRHGQPLIEVREVVLAHGRLDHVPAEDQHRAADARHVERRGDGVAERFGRRGYLRDDVEAAQVGRRGLRGQSQAGEHDSSQDQTASLHAKPPRHCGEEVIRRCRRLYADKTLLLSAFHLRHLRS